MEGELLEELRNCQEEKYILEKQIDINLDRWTFEKRVLEESAMTTARQYRLQEAEHAYDIARANLLLGSQKRERLVLQCKLESALEDAELRGVQSSALRYQLQEEREWFNSACKKMQHMRANFSIKVASESKKLVLESERKVHRIQMLLDEAQQRHMVEVEKIKERYTSAFSQLEKIQVLLLAEEDNLQQHNRNTQHTLVISKLQDLLKERDKMRTEKEQLKLSQEELQEKKMECKSLQDDIVRFNHERNELLAEKDRGIFHSSEMQKVAEERDGLNVERERWLSLEKDFQLVVKERDMLTSQLGLVTAQRAGEIKALLREKNFVWSQMKSIGDNDAERIKIITEQALQDRQEMGRLRREVRDAQVGNNERMVETTVLKLEAKRAEDLAVQTRHALEAEIKELHTTVETLRGENSSLLVHSMTRSSELASHKEALERKVDSASTTEEDVPASSKFKVCLEDKELLESQVEQASQVTKIANKKSLKSQEELQRENENLLLENRNLKVLYAELEVLYKKKLKPVKLARLTSRRDSTSRNLKLELEAAAISSPSEAILVSDKKPKKLKRSGRQGNKRLSKAYSSELSSGGGTSPDIVSHRKTRSSKRKVSDGKGLPSEKVSKPSSLRRKAVLNSEIPALDTLSEQPDAGSLQKRTKRKVSSGEPQSIKKQRPPLHTIPHNQKSGARPAAPRSTMKCLSQESENKSSPWSTATTNKSMADLFSSAFSVPRLKGLISRT